MIKRLLGVVLATFLSNSSFAQTNNNGFYETYIIVNNTYYDLGASTGNPNFEGNDLGTYSCSSGPILNGFEAKLFKCNSCDVTSVMLFYRIYKEGTTPGAFFSLDKNNAKEILGAGPGCQNQQWEHKNTTINILENYSNLPDGRYVFEAYTSGEGNNCAYNAFDDKFSNAGQGFKCYFTISTPLSIGSVVSSVSNICYGSNTTLSVTTQSGGTRYYWEKKNPDNSWTIVDENDFSGTIPNYTVTNLTEPATYRCRITNCNGSNEAISINEIPLSPQRPTITTQPASQTDCEGLTMRFITSATGSGTLSYQWQRKKTTDIGFTNITADAENVDVTTNNLFLSNIGKNSNPNLTEYRCTITDGSGCTNTTTAATININKVTGALDPTLCSGSSTVLTITLQGTANSYQWQKKIGSTWTDLTDGGNISGSSSATLGLNNVLASDNGADYRCKVIFNISTPNNNCTSSSLTTNNLCTTSTCTYTPDIVAEQNRLTVRTSPTAPTATSNPICGAGTVTLTATSSLGTNEVFRWYADNTTSTVLQQSTSTQYTTTSLAVGSYTYYVSVYNTSTTCESTRTAVTVIVNPIPTITLGTVADICPQANSFDLPYSATTESPNQYSISAGTPALSGFSAVTNAALGSSPLSIPIPANSTSGTYQFSISVRNSTTTCVSEPQNFNLTIKNPTVVTTNPSSQTVCENDNLTLSAAGTGSGTVTYQWRKDGSNLLGETSATYAITSIALTEAGNYDCLIIADCGTATTTAAVVVVNPKAKFTTQPTNQTVCREESATFSTLATGTGTLEFRWKKGSTILSDGTNILGSATNTLLLTNLQLADAGTYVCEVKGDCDADFVPSNAVTLTVNDLPALPTVTTPIYYCKDASASQLSATATSGNSLLWYGTNSTGGTSSNTAPTPLTNTAGTVTYYVSQKDLNGCESPRASISVITLPSVVASISGFDKICLSGVINNSTTLTTTATGGNGIYTYQWQNLAGNISSATNETYDVTNAFQSSTSDNYKVVVTSGACTATSTNVITVTKSGWTDISITGNTPDICGSGSKTLNIVSPIGGATYKWFSDATTLSSLNTGTSYNTPTINSTTTYYAAREGSVATGLTCQSNRASVTIVVNPTPSAPTITSSDADNTVCAGESISLTANGCSGTITWSNGSNGSVLSVTSAGTYNATCTVDGCVSEASSLQTIVVNAIPSAPSITSSDADNTICAGESISLTASGCSGTVLWSNGSNGSVLSVTSAGTYNATCTVNGCVSEASSLQTIVVNAIPSAPSITSSDADNTICAGESISLTASGCTGIVTWNNGTTGSVITISSSGTYNAICTLSGCESVASSLQTITVNSLPTSPSITSNDADNIICSGETITLSASGCAGTVIWNTGVSASTLTVNTAGTFNATCTVEGCVSTASSLQTIVVNSLPTAPTITSSDSDNTVCFGESISLSATGCTGTVTWSNGSNLTTITISASGTYNATCTENGCTSLPSTLQTITVNAIPSAPSITSSDADNTICSGSSINLTASGCSGTVNWSNGNNGSVLTVTNAGTYNAICNVNGCISSESSLQTIVVNAIPPAPIITSSDADNTICAGESISLTASGCTGTVNWSNGSTESTITVSSSGTYNATCTVNGCVSETSALQTIVVNALPTFATNPTDRIQCRAATTSFTGSTNSSATLQWEYRKTSTDSFVDVGSSTTGTSHSFSVSNVGSATYPDGSEFRLKATSNGCTTTSSSGFLRVNSVSGDITDQTKCLGSSTSLDGSILTVAGTVTGYQWESSTVSTSGFNPVS